MVRLMSDGELSRLEVLRDMDQKTVDDGGRGAAARARTASSVWAVEGQSDRSPNRLISKRRGRRSNRRKPEALGA
jgi:hypothetical protein